MHGDELRQLQVGEDSVINLKASRAGDFEDGQLRFPLGRPLVHNLQEGTESLIRLGIRPHKSFVVFRHCLLSFRFWRFSATLTTKIVCRRYRDVIAALHRVGRRSHGLYFPVPASDSVAQLIDICGRGPRVQSDILHWEVARLSGSLRARNAAILAYLDPNVASNGPTEAVNGVIETTRRFARSFRNITTADSDAYSQPAATPVPDQAAIMLICKWPQNEHLVLRRPISEWEWVAD